MAETLNHRLRNRLQIGPPLLIPGAANALTARIIVDVGFEAIYVTGAGIANSFLGVPDLGLISLADLEAHTVRIRDVVDCPLFVDADTAYGNPVGVYRTVRVLERAGANAVQLEDQIAPKRCGHFAGKRVISTAEMVAKINAALDARIDQDLVIIARTDARDSEGLEDALERAQAYREAGADLIFVESPRTEEELRLIPSACPHLHVVNQVVGGRTPLLPLDLLGHMGYRVVLYANAALQASIAAMQQTLQYLNDHGDVEGVKESLASWEERQRIVGKAWFDSLEGRYSRGQQ